MRLTEEQARAVSIRARHHLWRRGDLSWKLTPSSLACSEAFDAAPRLSTYVDESSRKVGKSYWAICKSFETLIKNPGRRSNYGCMTGKAATEIVLPILRLIAEDAPPELTPEYNSQTGHVTFPKHGPGEGAYMVLFGCEDVHKADRGRGPESVLNVIEEAAFIPCLRYVMSDVLKPQTIFTKAKTLIISSPPISMGHEFCAIADAARARGLYAHRNVYTPGGLFKTAEEVEEYIDSFAVELGMSPADFRKTATYKREILGERCVDERLAVVPEFSTAEHDTRERSPVTGEEVLLKGIVREHPRPPGWVHVDKYTVLDLGMSDFSAGLFGYADFLAGGLAVVEDDFLEANAGTQRLAALVKQKERELRYQHHDASAADHFPGKVWMRVADDTQGRLVSDFSNEHGLSISKARNDDPEAAIALLRLLVQQRKLVIHPRAKNFIRQLRHAVRKRPGGEIARSETEGHYDAVAAGMYFARTVDRTRNPYPPLWDLAPHLHVVGGPPGPKVNPLATALLKTAPVGRRVLRGKR